MCNISQIYLQDKNSPKLSNLLVELRILLAPYFSIHETNNSIKSGNYLEGEYELINHINPQIAGKLSFYESVHQNNSNWNFYEFAVTIEIKTSSNKAICLDIHWHPDQEEKFHGHLHVHEFEVNLNGTKSWEKETATLKDNYKNQKLASSYSSTRKSLLAFGKDLDLKRANDIESGYCIDNVTTKMCLDNFIDELHSHYYNLYCI